MKITVLSNSGMSSALEAWRLSRNLDHRVEARELDNLDLPALEMPSAHLHFEDFTILEREVFATPRNHVMWARTSHVDDPIEFKVPELLDPGQNFIEETRRGMMGEKAMGKSQDEWREHLPVTSLTSWTARWSYRDLVKMTRYFGYLATSVPSRELSMRFGEVYDALLTLLTIFVYERTRAEWVVNASKMVPFLNEGMLSARGGRVGSFQVMALDVPLWMRAQIVRHRPLAFVDDFFLTFLMAPDVLTRRISHPVRMELATTQQFWRSILSKRTCWLAQDSLQTRRDPWQEIIDANGFSEDMLPCAGGSCPYYKDASLRLTEEDPGAPCPRYINLHAPDRMPEFAEEIRGALQSRHSFWAGELGMGE